MDENAFGIAKHYLGHHYEHKGKPAAHSRQDHGKLRSEKRASNRVFNEQHDAAYTGGYNKHATDHPFSHGSEVALRRLGRDNPGTMWEAMAPKSLSADRAGTTAAEEWRGSEHGRKVAEAADRAKGKWNPRYEQRRKARQKAEKVAKNMTNAFGVEHVSKSFLPVRNKGLKLIAAGEPARKAGWNGRKVNDIKSAILRGGSRRNSGVKGANDMRRAATDS